MLLSMLIFIPIIGAILIAFAPRERLDLIRWLALITSLITLIISLPLYGGDFNANPSGYLFEEQYA